MTEPEMVDQARAAEGPLLPGETADTDESEDAEHWAAVYEELTGFLLQFDSPDGMLERFRRRLSHWQCRRDQLAGSPNANGQSRVD